MDYNFKRKQSFNANNRLEKQNILESDKADLQDDEETEKDYKYIDDEVHFYIDVLADQFCDIDAQGQYIERIDRRESMDISI